MTSDAADTRLTVDLDALAANYRCVGAEAGGAEMAPVVKADGYGLGAGPVARRLWAEGARRFFVARTGEGEQLRRALGDRTADILVLDGLVEGSAARLEAAGLTPVLSTRTQTEAWRGLTSRPAVLQVDTGMNRMGLDAEEAEALARSGFPVALVMSHLGRAAEPGHPRNTAQLERFREVHARASLAASAGVFLGPDYRYDLVRPGICLYGGGPFDRPDPRIAAVATLDAPILQIRDLAAGESAGYGAMFTAREPLRIGVAGAGYADGVLRRSYSQGVGWIGGAPAPFVIVTMDLIAVDLRNSPGAKVGDRVEFLGPHAQLDDVAAAAGSVAHEVLVRLSPRTQRHYRGEAA